jgi:hypothetical protein
LLGVTVLLDGAGKPVLLLLMLLVMLLLLPILLLLDLLMITTHTLEMRAGKGTRATGLEGASQEQLRGKQRRELHVKSCARGGHLGGINGSLLLLLLLMLMLMLLGVHGLGIDAWNVATTGVPISKPADVGGKGAMRETRVTVGRLRNVSVTATRCTGAILKAQVLHPEQMRRDEAVPVDVR